MTVRIATNFNLVDRFNFGRQRRTDEQPFDSDWKNCRTDLVSFMDERIDEARKMYGDKIKQDIRGNIYFDIIAKVLPDVIPINGIIIDMVIAGVLYRNDELDKYVEEQSEVWEKGVGTWNPMLACKSSKIYRAVVNLNSTTNTYTFARFELPSEVAFYEKCLLMIPDIILKIAICSDLIDVLADRPEPERVNFTFNDRPEQYGAISAFGNGLSGIKFEPDVNYLFVKSAVRNSFYSVFHVDAGHEDQPRIVARVDISAATRFFEIAKKYITIPEEK